MDNRWGVVILAAGESTRMGRMKASLEIGGSTSFLEHILMQYERVGRASVHLVVNQTVEHWWNRTLKEKYINVRLCRNNHPQKGMLHSVLLGLNDVPPHRDVFVQPIDSPLVYPDLLQEMATLLEENKWVKPMYQNRGGHPVLLSYGLVARIVQQPVTAGSLKELLSDFPVQKLKVRSKSILWNINAPEDYREFLTTMK